MDREDACVLFGIIGGITGLILLLLGICYYFNAIENYNSIPYYDKYCHLNMTQTWNNAYKLNWIDLHWCNYNNVEIQH